MADQKITQLTELAAIPASNDMLAIVDVSDTTMSSGGTTKKIAASRFVNTNADKTFITGDGTTGTLPQSGTVPVVDRANTFTAANTFSAVNTFTLGMNVGSSTTKISRDDAGVLKINHTGSTSLADNGTIEVGSGTYGILLVTNASNGRTGLFLVNTSTLILISESSTGHFTTTADNPGTYNVYSNGGVLTIQNKTGNTRTTHVVWIGRSS